MIRYILILFIFYNIDSYSQDIFAERKNFTRQDSLRGSITKERIWWDLSYYHLDIKVDPEKKYIEGYNTVKYEVSVYSPTDTAQTRTKVTLAVCRCANEGQLGAGHHRTSPRAPPPGAYAAVPP